MSLPPEGSKKSLKKHLLAIWKRNPTKKPKMLEQPPLPEEFEHLWQYYIELQSVDRITFQEIDCWSRLTHRFINSTEVDIIRKLDLLYWTTINGRSLTSDNQGK